ncbi:MAG: GNAT family N-acetyltransferase [Anaerolineales bacterium]|nr:GNAT family N-acetyltransferase [Anaerolineales bacterium]
MTQSSFDELQSLAYRTDLMLLAFDSQITERDEFWVIRSPHNPRHYWGNFLLFKRPPRPEDKPRWQRLFTEEIGRPPEVEHQVFGWDSAEGELGEVQPFLADGFRLEQVEVLAAEKVHPPRHYNHDVEVRPLSTYREWEQARENQLLVRDPEHEARAHRAFLQGQLDRRRAMAGAGWGDWYGAFLDGELIADLGIFGRRELGRYQSVQTHPAFRRRGIAGTLVYEAARHAKVTRGFERLVIVADRDSDAGRLYGSLGFSTVGRAAGLERWPGIAT